MSNKKPGSALHVLGVAIAMGSGAALAGPTFEIGEKTTIDTMLTVNYTASVRTGKPARQYLESLNNDDGTRNFDRGSLITNRVSLFGEVLVRHDNLGAVLRASHFYDEAYHGRNDNDSPDTVNKGGRHDTFTSDTRRDSGGRARLLDAYVYGNFDVLEGQYLSLKAGRHLVAWGESMFWPNISQGQAPVDSTKFNVPGTPTTTPSCRPGIAALPLPPTNPTTSPPIPGPPGPTTLAPAVFVSRRAMVTTSQWLAATAP